MCECHERSLASANVLTFCIPFAVAELLFTAPQTSRFYLEQWLFLFADTIAHTHARTHTTTSSKTNTYYKAFNVATCIAAWTKFNNRMNYDYWGCNRREKQTECECVNATIPLVFFKNLFTTGFGWQRCTNTALSAFNAFKICWFLQYSFLIWWWLRVHYTLLPLFVCIPWCNFFLFSVNMIVASLFRNSLVR